MQRVTLKDIAPWFDDGGWPYPDGVGADNQYFVDVWGAWHRVMVGNAFRRDGLANVESPLCFVCGKKHKGFLDGLFPEESLSLLEPHERWVLRKETYVFCGQERIRYRAVEAPNARELAFHREHWKRVAEEIDSDERSFRREKRREYDEVRERGTKIESPVRHHDNREFLLKTEKDRTRFVSIEKENEEFRTAWEKEQLEKKRYRIRKVSYEIDGALMDYAYYEFLDPEEVSP